MVAILTTLEQWRTAIAVVDEGGFANAAKSLRKSQSTVSHAISELNRRLGMDLFELRGRRAILTPAGAVLLRRARLLLSDATALEAVADSLSRGMEAQLTIAVDTIVPTPLLVATLNDFAEQSPQTRVEVQEVVLSGVVDQMTEGDATLAVSAILPPGHQHEPLMDIEFIGVAHPQHPIHELDQPVDYDDLRRFRQMIVRDTGRRQYDAGWQEAEQRWTFSNFASSIAALAAGSGFAWVPAHMVVDELAAGLLRPLAMRRREERRATINLIARDFGSLGPAAQLLTASFRRQFHQQRAADLE
jgi:DNA-binding transcriptional LysR family regulator